MAARVAYTHHVKPQIAAEIVATVLFALAIVHARWGVVGLSPRSATIPEVGGRALFVPSRTACFAVATALFAASSVLLVQSGRLPTVVGPWLGLVGSAAVGGVLVLRAVGDFRYVGFFKRVRGTTFATLDSYCYSPLCLVLGALALWAVFGRSG